MISRLANKSGFTLIEVIVTIVVSAILAVLLMQLMSGHITRSRWALDNMDESLALREVMEIINSDYRLLITENLTPLVTLHNNIDNGGYWDTQPYGPDIQVDDNYCLDLNQDQPHGEFATGPCDPNDTLLKVTLGYRGHTLTTLFSR